MSFVKILCFLCCGSSIQGVAAAAANPPAPLVETRQILFVRHGESESNKNKPTVKPQLRHLLPSWLGGTSVDPDISREQWRRILGMEWDANSIADSKWIPDWLVRGLSSNLPYLIGGYFTGISQDPPLTNRGVYDAVECAMNREVQEQFDENHQNQ